jgi:DNA end-binding protein Ku
MRAIWSGSIAFGLVNIPVKLFSGSESHHGLDLTMLHKQDHSPIRYARVCRKDGKEVAYDQIVKGYEWQEGDYIELTDDDFKKADAHKSKSIDIKQFVNEEEIDSRYFEKPYWLEPGKGADRAYAVLRDALVKSGKIALARFAMRSRENMAAIKPLGNALVLNQMRFPADLRNPTDLKFPEKNAASKEEVDMAFALLKQLEKPFIAEDWHDTYTEELEDVIAAKAKGKKPKQHGAAPEATKVKDLMATLRESLDKQKVS